jgi:phage protein D
MAKRLDVQTELERLQPFGWVGSVEVTSSWESLADLCTLTLPRGASLNQGRLQDQIRRGDRLRIKAGYDGNLRTIFQGYVSSVGDTVPIELEAEDEMWQLKQRSFDRTFENAMLPDVLAVLAEDYEVQALAIELGEFVVEQRSACSALKWLQDNMNVQSYFLSKTLYSGWAYQHEPNELLFDFQRNVKDTDLEFQRAEDVKLQVKATSYLGDGKKHEITLGDDQGEQRTLSYSYISKQELRRRAEREMEKLRYDGYNGSFTAWGEPAVRHGDIVKLQDANYPERGGRYFVDEVVTKIGVDSGMTQTITLGKKAFDEDLQTG